MLQGLIQNLTKITKDGKQSYFGKKWGADTGLKKNLDRKDYTFDDVSDASPHRQLNEQILTGFKQTPDGEKSSFVEKLTQESLSFLAERKGVRLQKMADDALKNEAMTILMARLFGRLEAFSIELNSYLGCTDLRTVLTRATHVREVTKFNKARQPMESVTYYRGRIGTHLFSLVIRGREGKIEVFLVPVEQVMGLSKSEQMYQPLAVLNAVLLKETETVEWELGDKYLTSAREQELCMEIFATLIQQTREQMKDDAEAAEVSESFVVLS